MSGMTTLSFTVLGEPMSKGSMTAEAICYGDGTPVIRHGKIATKIRPNNGRHLERNAKGIEAVALQAREAARMALLRDVALKVTLRYYTASPNYRYGSGRNAEILKDNAAARPHKRPDVDKWCRQTLDALTGVIYADDGQVVTLVAEKHYADDGQPPRTEIEVEVLEQQTVGLQVAVDQLELAAA